MSAKFDNVFLHPGHLIRRAHQIHMSVFEDEFAIHDISAVQYLLLTVIEELEGVDLTTAARLAAVDKASCTRFVSRLVSRGLVSAVSDESDQRRKLLTLTDKGRELIPELDLCAEVVRKKVMERMTPEQQQQFIDFLDYFAALNNDLSRAPHQSPAEARKRYEALRSDNKQDVGT